MNEPTLYEPYRAASDVYVIPSFFPVPGFGILPVNAFVIKGAEPVLVDAGLVPLGGEFMKMLSALIDPADLKWLWLTHGDQDHTGSLHTVLDRAPELRVITTFLGAGRMSLSQPLSPERIYFLNPGQRINMGDRTLTALKPPAYDAPETTALYDSKSEAYFSADCFGALMQEPVENAADMGAGRLREGLLTWATVDFPWLHLVDKKPFAASLDRIRALAPSSILSHHLPAAHDMTADLLDFLADVPAMKPFVGPDQQAFEAMLREAQGK
jgi:hypothetical protein